MNTTIQKWGNSLAVRLPKGVVRERALFEGSEVTVRSDKGRIIITPMLKKTKSLDLAELIRGVSKKNTHKEVTWDNPQGNEVW